MKLVEKIYTRLPYFCQNIGISFINTLQYKMRQGGEYPKWRKFYSDADKLSKDDLIRITKERLNSFLNIASTRSPWYKEYLGRSLSEYPILKKVDIVNNLRDIATISEKGAHISLTGGTTGASLRVIYTAGNIQERNAILDHFRAKYGYNLGKKCAWFSGKNIASEKDVEMGLCYRDDYFNRIRFFSTFHLTDKNFDVYWRAFCKFAPEFVVGFPSSVFELCSMASSRGLRLDDTVKVFFPTAETVLPAHRNVIKSVLGCRILDQYASSEGAPFILECEEGGLHIHPLTGIFEVVDENLQSAQEGEILVTSFTTEGTPLIRYRIGDRIRLGSEETQCPCGSKFPFVERIEGRAADFLLSPTHGKVSSANIGNSTKGVNGIIQFQIVQEKLDCVQVLIVRSHKFDSDQSAKFKAALIDRLGPRLNIDLQVVESISKERSGKSRLVKCLVN